MGFVNIHGKPIDMANLWSSGVELRRKQRAAGIAVGRKPTIKNGYAAPPGSGPMGETCKGCKHKLSIGNGGKHYIKCELRRATWTNGEGTDILAGSPACKKFEGIES